MIHIYSKTNSLQILIKFLTTNYLEAQTIQEFKGLICLLELCSDLKTQIHLLNLFNCHQFQHYTEQTQQL